MSTATRLLGRLTGRRAPTKADTVTALPTPAGSIDGAAWYTEHERLSYDLVTTMARANVGPITALGKHNRQVTAAQAALLAHARLISGAQEPILMAKDGVHTIPFQKLADARAQIQVLEAELAKLRAMPTWKPQFDAMAADQKDLAMLFCQVITGSFAGEGQAPDPVRLLEMAEALYQAERKALQP